MKLWKKMKWLIYSIHTYTNNIIKNYEKGWEDSSSYPFYLLSVFTSGNGT